MLGCNLSGYSHASLSLTRCSNPPLRPDLPLSTNAYATPHKPLPAMSPRMHCLVSTLSQYLQNLHMFLSFMAPPLLRTHTRPSLSTVTHCPRPHSRKCINQLPPMTINPPARQSPAPSRAPPPSRSELRAAAQSPAQDHPRSSIPRTQTRKPRPPHPCMQTSPLRQTLVCYPLRYATNVPYTT
jgi:hypothetical protein